MKLGRVEVGSSFLFLGALLLYWDQGGLLAACALGAALHELGHILSARLMGAKVRRLAVTALGAEMELDRRDRLSYRQELFVLLAGPAVSLLAGLAAARGPWRGWPGMDLFAGANLALGVFNLLPLAALDGGQAVRCGLLLVLTPARGEAWAARLSRGCALLLLMAGAWAAAKGGQVTILLLGLWAAASCRKREGEK